MLVPSSRSIDLATQSHRHVQAAHLWGSQVQAQDAIACLRTAADFNNPRGFLAGFKSVVVGAAALIILMGVVAIVSQ